MILREPTLIDTALCAMNLIEEDRKQWIEFAGEQYADPSLIAYECWSYPGPRWAICDEEGMALAVAGCRLARRGVYQTWFLSGNELWTHGKRVTEVTQRVMREVLATRAHRIETICLESRGTTRAWYEKVGLHYEGLLPYYGVTGANAVQYAIYRTPGS